MASCDTFGSKPSLQKEKMLSDAAIEMLLSFQNNVGRLRLELRAFFEMLQLNESECRYFSTSEALTVKFFNLMHAPGVDDENMDIIHDILLFTSEEDYKRDRAGLKNMINCTFLVNNWDEYLAVIYRLLDTRNAKVFRDTSRLHVLYTYVNEIRRSDIPVELRDFVDIRAKQLVRALQVFPDVQTLESTLNCLWAVSATYDETCDAIARDGAGLVLLQLIQNNKEKGLVVELSLQILNMMTAQLLKSNHELFTLSESGLYKVVAGCILQHGSRKDLVDAACTILRKGLATRKEDIRALQNDGVLLNDIVEGVRSTHVGNPAIEMTVSQLVHVLNNPHSPLGSGTSSSSLCSTPRNGDAERGDKTPRKRKETHRRGRARSVVPEDKRPARMRYSSRSKSQASLREMGKLQKGSMASSGGTKDVKVNVQSTRALLTPKGRAEVRARFLKLKNENSSGADSIP